MRLLALVLVCVYCISASILPAADRIVVNISQANMDPGNLSELLVEVTNSLSAKDRNKDLLLIMMHVNDDLPITYDLHELRYNHGFKVPGESEHASAEGWLQIHVLERHVWDVLKHRFFQEPYNDGRKVTYAYARKIFSGFAYRKLSLILDTVEVHNYHQYSFHVMLPFTKLPLGKSS